MTIPTEGPFRYDWSHISKSAVKFEHMRLTSVFALLASSSFCLISASSPIVDKRCRNLSRLSAGPSPNKPEKNCFRVTCSRLILTSICKKILIYTCLKVKIIIYILVVQVA